MSTSGRDIKQLFALLRDTAPASPAFSREEIEAIVANANDAPMPAARPLARYRRTVAVAAALLVIGVPAALLVIDHQVINNQVIGNHVGGNHVGGNHDDRAAAVVAAHAPALRAHVDAPSNPSAAPLAAAGTMQQVTPQRARIVTRVTSAPRRRVLKIDDQPISDRTAKPLESSLVMPATIHDTTAPTQLPSIGIMELTPAELQRLNITINGTVIETVAEEAYSITNEKQARVFAAMGVDTTVRNGMRRGRVMLDTFAASTNWNSHEPGSTQFSRVAPIAVMNVWTQGMHRSGSTLIYFERSPILSLIGRPTDQLARALDNVVRHPQNRTVHDGNVNGVDLATMLVPIYVHIDGGLIPGSTLRAGADITLWYYPTPEFVDALPDRYRDLLRRELAAIADVEEHHLPQNQVCQRLTGEQTLLNFCSRSSGALVGASVRPNPAHDHVAFEYTLSDRRIISITLHDERGVLVQDLAPMQTVDAGPHAINLPLSGVDSGVYLIVMRSERGEQVIQRVIVQ